MKTLKRLFSATLFVLVAGLAAANLPQADAMAETPVASLNLSSSGLALRGYDPVAYFTAGKPVKGSDKITAKHAGGTYYFSSEGNKESFLASPANYLPQYGGFCAYGTAAGYKVDGDPNVWNVVDGKLYLNINKSVDRAWDRKQSYYIRKADKSWPKIRNK